MGLGDGGGILGGKVCPASTLLSLCSPRRALRGRGQLWILGAKGGYERVLLVGVSDIRERGQCPQDKPQSQWLDAKRARTSGPVGTT